MGRIVRDPQLHEIENGLKVTTITIAVPRAFKNANGEYDADFITCSIWKGVAENVCEYCHKGDLIGVKGHIQTREEKTDEVVKYITDIVAEKVTFLSSKKAE